MAVKVESIKPTSLEVTEETVTTGATGTTIYTKGSRGTVTLTPSGTARIEYSISRASRLRKGLGRWFAWGRGDVTTPVGDVIDQPVVAVRVVSVSGDATIEVCQ